MSTSVMFFATGSASRWTSLITVSLRDDKTKHLSQRLTTFTQRAYHTRVMSSREWVHLYQVGINYVDRPASLSLISDTLAHIHCTRYKYIFIKHGRDSVDFMTYSLKSWGLINTNSGIRFIIINAFDKSILIVDFRSLPFPSFYLGIIVTLFLH